MIEQPKGRFWQIHLSTAVILMFMAGIFLWLNMRGVVQQRAHAIDRIFGWPCVTRVEQIRPAAPELDFDEYPFSYGSLIKYANDIVEATAAAEERRARQMAWAKNILAALASLFACAVICEYRIRRFEARKP